MDDHHFEVMVTSLREAFATGVTRQAEWRRRQLEAMINLLDREADKILEALHQDLRRPETESVHSEVLLLRNEAEALLEALPSLMQPRQASKPPMFVLSHATVRPEPYGVALIMGAWNYPLLTTLGPLMGALAAGNCAVVKPSEVSASTAKALADLLPRYLDNDCLRVVCGGVSEASELVKVRFDYLFYTGGTEVGRLVREATNRFLTPCTLELGGKNPAYVADDCNVEVAAKRILWGKCVNLGQVCVAPDYLMCSRDMQAKLLAQFDLILRSWYGTDQRSSPDLARMVNARHFQRVQDLLKSTKATVALGGKSYPEEKFIEVTVLTDVDPDNDPVMKSGEIFGPILPMVTVEDAASAIKRINAGEKPLTVYIFTENEEVGNMFMNGTSSGSLVVNDCLVHLAFADLPFGGVGYSGMGAYKGKASFDTFTHYKSVLRMDTMSLTEKIGSVRYPPYTDASPAGVRALMARKTLPWVTSVPGLLFRRTPAPPDDSKSPSK